MYFVPVLFAVLTLLLFPSYLAAGIVGLSTAAYFRFAGFKVADLGEVTRSEDGAYVWTFPWGRLIEDYRGMTVEQTPA